MTCGALIDELIVDNFAGGGGASEGLKIALGRDVDVAINHDAEACAMHAINHPTAIHHCQSVWKADPRDVVAEASKRRGADRPLPVGIAWFSPDCKDFSKAKGGQPVEKHIRDLAWVVVHWAKLVRPRIIMLENVEEFRDWGPLIEAENGKLVRCPVQKGFTFRRWCRALKKLGYVVEHRELRACDYGAPTIRKRLFVVARCDGLPIVWPAPTHAKGGAGGLLPWRSAAECIDWSIPIPSIFGRKRDLVEKTLARIARGIRRYVLDTDTPFIVGVGSRAAQSPERPVDAPFGTVTATKRGQHALVVPVTHAGDERAHSIDEPLRTITTANRGEHALVAAHVTKFRGGATGASMDDPMPTITANSHVARPGGAAPLGVVGAAIAPFLSPRYGERPGQEPRIRSVEEPAPTIVPTGNGGDLAAAFVAKQTFGGETSGPPASDVADPLHTVTTQGNRFNVAAAFVGRQFGRSTGTSPEDPVGTVTAGGGKTHVAAAFIPQHNTGMVGHDARDPVSTIVGKGCTQGVAAAFLSSFDGSGGGEGDPAKPAKTVRAEGQHHSVAAAWVSAYYSSGGQEHAVDSPLPTITTQDRFGAQAAALGEDLSEEDRYAAWWCARFVEQYAPRPVPLYPAPRPAMLLCAGRPIIDIGLRMFVPPELFRAQGFPRNYVIDRGILPDGRVIHLTKTAQVRMVGNSVSPPQAVALAQANYFVTAEAMGALGT